MIEASREKLIKQANPLFSRLFSFAVELGSSATSENQSEIEGFPETMFSNVDLGMIGFSGPEAITYSGLCDQFLAALGDLSGREFVQKSIQTFLLKVLDPVGRKSEIPVRSRAKSAMEEMKLGLFADHVAWTVCIPLYGLAPPKLPWTINSFTIASIKGATGEKLFRSVRAISKTTTNTPEEKRQFLLSIDQNFVAKNQDNACLFIAVNALTAESAWEKGKQFSQLLVDCLNFILTVVCQSANPHYCVSDIDPVVRPARQGAIVDTAGRKASRFPREMVGHLQSIGADLVRQKAKEERWICHLLEIIGNRDRSPHDHRLVSSLRWAGRSVIEKRPDQKFLDKAISLESLLLNSQESGISSNLSLSVVHLLKDLVRDKIRSRDDIRRLYRLRSKIVHNGTLEIDSADDHQLWTYTFACFRELLSKKKFLRMSRAEDLDAWLEKSMCGD